MHSTVPGAIFATLASLSILRAGDSNSEILLRYGNFQPTMVKARQAFVARHFSEVQTDLKPCLKAIPDHYEAQFLLAQMAYAVGDYSQALMHIEVAERSLDHLNDMLHHQKEAIARTRSEQNMELKSSFDSLTAMSGGEYGCSASLAGDLKANITSLNEEDQALDQTEALLPTPASYHFVHGNCLYRLGRNREAISQFETATRIDPHHGDAWNNLINLQYLAKDFFPAFRSLQEAERLGISINPKLKEAVLRRSSTP